jgi:hypothetical protein
MWHRDFTLVSRSSYEEILILAPVAAVAVYVVGDVISSLLYDGYNVRDQAIRP